MQVWGKEYLDSLMTSCHNYHVCSCFSLVFEYFKVGNLLHIFNSFHIIMLLHCYVITLFCEEQKLWRMKEKKKDNIAKLQYQIISYLISNYILSLYPVYPHPDSLKKFQAKKFLNWTGTRFYLKRLLGL